MKPLDSKGVVAAGHQLTAKAAAEMLRAGGTAIDAAIAALAMSCVSEPVLSSPGGGGFAMLRDGSSGTISIIDFFPQTPIERRQTGQVGVNEIRADFGTATQAFHIGPATSATPGFFAGIAMLHRKGACMPLADLFAPAINAARIGVTVTSYQHYLSTVVQPILTATASTAELFSPDGVLLEPGMIFRNPGIADAFEIMSGEGFAQSDVGQSVVASQDFEGHLTEQDLVAFAAIEREPLSVPVGSATVHLNPLPAAGGILIAHSLANLDSSSALHLAHAFAATNKARRECEGDLGSLSNLPVRQRGTTHISIIDSAGNACAVTVSNGEGNGELVGRFGFMLNNVLGEEDVNPQAAANWPTDTRLASMMCPSLIEAEDGSLVALGSGGSNRIRSAICQVIARHCLDQASLEEAVAAPRLHLEGGHLDFEDFFNPVERLQLCRPFPDHRAWPDRSMFFGGVHAVLMDRRGQFSGVGDPRRDGIAMTVA